MTIKHFNLKALSVILCLSSIFTLTSNAQQAKIKYYSADEFYLYGKAKPTATRYHRIDTSEYSDLPPRVKSLLTNSSGLAISFKTNSSSISAKWCVTKLRAANNMTPIAQKGLDIYIKKDGKWQFAGVGKPSSICSEANLIKSLEKGEKECLIYLPLYDELKNLEIGIDPGSNITTGVNPFRNKIVLYGSSIVQGASAGRPGMTYPAILSRKTGLSFITLGLSGNAKMEPAAARMVSDIPADAYILDCVPNPSPGEIKERAENFIKKIRDKNPKAPIICVLSIIREHGYFNTTVGKINKQQNEEMTAAFNRLKKAGMKDIYLITEDKLLGDDHDATTDGTHPNDLGFYRMAEKLGPQITNILSQYNIK